MTRLHSVGGLAPLGFSKAMAKSIGAGSKSARVYVRLAEKPCHCGRSYAEVLDLVRSALRAGDLETAESSLMHAASVAGDDPVFFTLIGVWHECRGKLRAARKSYGKAIAADGSFAPAQQNMRRLYELSTFGRTRESVSLADEIDLLEKVCCICNPQ